MIKYGLISETDARCLEKTIGLICDGFKYGATDALILVTEIGVYSGATSGGLCKYLMNNKNRIPFITGIDNSKDGQEIEVFPDKLIIGNSNEVYNQLEDNSQHLIFVDGCHCFAHVISDFFCYAPKVKVGGYIAFHDTGEHIKPFKDFQHGDKENPDAYISVRKALEKIGLLWAVGSNEFIDRYAEEWELVFDEADPENEAGGVTVFKKLY